MDLKLADKDKTKY